MIVHTRSVCSVPKTGQSREISAAVRPGVQSLIHCFHFGSQSTYTERPFVWLFIYKQTMKFITSSCLFVLLSLQAATAENDVRTVRRLRNMQELLQVQDNAVPKSEHASAEREILSRLLQDGSMSM